MNRVAAGLQRAARRRAVLEDVVLVELDAILHERVDVRRRGRSLVALLGGRRVARRVGVVADIRPAVCDARAQVRQRARQLGDDDALGQLLAAGRWPLAARGLTVTCCVRGLVLCLTIVGQNH